MHSAQATSGKTIDIARLPTLPQVVFQLLDECESSSGNMTDIANLIRQDAALASRVLALSASPVYAQFRSNRTVSLEQSLMHLGLNAVRTLALTAAVYHYVDHSLGSHAQLLQSFWRKSLLTANLAGRLAKLSGYAAHHEAYLAGLISNFGQIALLAQAPADYSELLEKTHAVPDDLVRREVTAFGIDHAALGALMLQRAGRSGPFTDAVRYHHTSAEALANAHHLVRLVAVANRLVEADRSPEATAFVEADRLLGLIPSLLDEVFVGATEQTEQTVREFGVTPTASGPSTFANAGTPSPLAKRLSELHIISAVRRQLDDSDDLEGLCKASQLACGLLFDVHAIGFILVQDGPENAIGYSATDPAGIWPELVFKLPDERSLVGSALSLGIKRQHYPWDEALAENLDPAVVDLEIISLLQRQGLLALPLAANGMPVGVMLIGVDPDDATRLAEHSSLLDLFAKEVGTAFATLRLRSEQHDTAFKAQAAEFRLRTHSVVHEVKNPLSIIQNYLNILGKHAATGSPDVPNDIRIIGEEIARVGAILRTLTDAVDENGDDGITRLNALIEDVASLVRPTLITPAEIELELSLDADIPDIALSRSSVKQILVNLIKNAAEALSAGQTISIRTEDYIYSGRNAYVGIDISDNGPGIPPQILAKLFEPVASTKGKGHSGLGLSITKRLVDDLRGHIHCHSNAQGTRFQILLPRTLPDT